MFRAELFDAACLRASAAASASLARRASSSASRSAFSACATASRSSLRASSSALTRSASSFVSSWCARPNRVHRKSQERSPKNRNNTYHRSESPTRVASVRRHVLLRGYYMDRCTTQQHPNTTSTRFLCTRFCCVWRAPPRRTCGWASKASTPTMLSTRSALIIVMKIGSPAPVFFSQDETATATCTAVDQHTACSHPPGVWQLPLAGAASHAPPLRSRVASSPPRLLSPTWPPVESNGSDGNPASRMGEVGGWVRRRQ